MDGELSGQWALVTGASKGIGYGISEKLLGAGANVVLVARNEADLEEARATLQKAAGPGQEVLVRSADTADREAIAEVFAWVRAELPGLNILVANAGTGSLIPFLELTPEQWDATIALDPDRDVPVRAGGGSDHGGHARGDEPVDRGGVVDPRARHPPGAGGLHGHQVGREPARAHGGLRAGGRRHPRQRAVAGHHRHAAGDRRQPRRVRVTTRHDPDGPAGHARGHGRRRALPLRPGIDVRDRHQHGRRRRRVALVSRLMVARGWCPR